jgi:hypothetical protein
VTATGRRLPSRIQGPRRILKQLRALLVRNARSAEHRAVTPEEQRWSWHVQDRIEQLVAEGDAVLPGHEDPRDRRRARKRQQPSLIERTIPNGYSDHRTSHDSSSSVRRGGAD